MINNSSETQILSKDEALGVIDLRPTEYYKMKQSTIQHHLQCYYEFKALQVVLKEFNMLTNTIEREEQQSTDPYPWLVEDDERRNLTDRELFCSGNFLFKPERKGRIYGYAIQV